MKPITCSLAASLLIGLSATAADADVDGSFCVGPGYAAVEARGIHLDAAEPTVHVIFVNGAHLSARLAVSSPATGNRTMRCDASAITLSDGTVIDLNDGDPRLSKVRAEPAASGTDELLPFLRESKAVLIPSSDEDHYHSLVLSHVEQTLPVEGALLHHFSARVVRSDRVGNFVEARTLAAGIRLETVD